MKIRNKVMSVVLAAPLMVLAGTAVAMDPAELLGTLDADGNGSISQEEAAANEDLMGKWDELDANADGEISAEELAAMAE